MICECIVDFLCNHCMSESLYASGMTTLQVNPSLPIAKVLISEGSSNYGQRGPDVTGYPTYRNFGMGTGAGRVALRQNNHTRRKFPVIQPLSKSREWKALVSGIKAAGSPDLAKDVKLASENVPEKDICGKHFIFDNKCTRLERTQTMIPPLPRGYRIHSRHRLGLPQELSHSHAGRPFTLGYTERFDLSASPTILCPSTLVLNGRNTFLVENCKLSRPKVNYPNYHLLPVKDNQKSQSYPDPMVGASRSFIHRISELSSLEGETVRQEKLRKMKKPRKPPS